jgi:GT2 family glycosyltransferase
MIRVSGTIVIYNEQPEVLQKSMESFLALPCEKELIVVDNSPHNRLEQFVMGYDNTTYLKTQENVGFGKAHNVGFEAREHPSEFHMIINPDISFDAQSFWGLVLWLRDHTEVSLVTPMVLNEDGTRQRFIRQIPSFANLFMRRFNVMGVFDRFIVSQEIDVQSIEEVMEIPFAHGAFLVTPSLTYQKLQGYDERFFLYMEDVDLFIRAKALGKTVVHPDFAIYHEHRKGSSKSLKLMIYHVISAFKFFLKRY